MYNVIKPEVDKTNAKIKLFFLTIDSTGKETQTCRVLSPIDFDNYRTFRKALIDLFDSYAKAEYGSDKMNPSFYDLDRS